MDEFHLLSNMGFLFSTKAFIPSFASRVRKHSFTELLSNLIAFSKSISKPLFIHSFESLKAMGAFSTISLAIFIEKSMSFSSLTKCSIKPCSFAFFAGIIFPVNMSSFAFPFLSILEVFEFLPTQDELQV